MEDYKFKLNIKAISLFEQMTGIPYTNIDYASIDETTKLLYCCIIANNNVKHTFNEFVVLLNNKKFYKSISDKLKEEIKFNEQFISQDKQICDNKTPDVKLCDIIPILTNQCNLSIDYVMHDMALYEIGLHINNYNKLEQTNLEMQRLWTYYSILPHVDGKKLKSPKDLLSFNWEVVSEDVIKDITDEDFDKMIKSAPKLDNI